MNTANIILSVIAVAVVIIASILVYKWNEEEQTKRNIQDAVAKVKAEEEQKELERLGFNSTEQQRILEDRERARQDPKFAAEQEARYEDWLGRSMDCISKIPDGMINGNSAAEQKCLDME